MDATSALLLDNIKHVMHLAEEAVFKVCQRGLSFILKPRLTKSGRSIPIWPLCKFSTISGHLGSAVNVTIKCGFPIRVTAAIASNFFLLRFAGAP